MDSIADSGVEDSCADAAPEGEHASPAEDWVKLSTHGFAPELLYADQVCPKLRFAVLIAL
eukprot:3191839-Alexandrium_andersonii.AAC.1